MTCSITFSSKHTTTSNTSLRQKTDNSHSSKRPGSAHRLAGGCRAHLTETQTRRRCTLPLTLSSCGPISAGSCVCALRRPVLCCCSPVVLPLFRRPLDSHVALQHREQAVPCVQGLVLGLEVVVYILIRSAKVVHVGLLLRRAWQLHVAAHTKRGHLRVCMCVRVCMHNSNTDQQSFAAAVAGRELLELQWQR